MSGMDEKANISKCADCRQVWPLDVFCGVCDLCTACCECDPFVCSECGHNVYQRYEYGSRTVFVEIHSGRVDSSDCWDIQDWDAWYCAACDSEAVADVRDHLNRLV